MSNDAEISPSYVALIDGATLIVARELLGLFAR